MPPYSQRTPIALWRECVRERKRELHSVEYVLKSALSIRMHDGSGMEIQKKIKTLKVTLR